MNSIYTEIIDDLEKDLKQVELENTDSITTSESSILLIENCLKKLRSLVISNEFTSIQDEIMFFKHIKPTIVSKFIYYAKLLNVESKRPQGSAKLQKKYFEAEIHNCQEYFIQHHLFYQYFKAGETIPDEQFFLRKNKSVRIQFECCDSYVDDQFATSLDGTFAKFMGYELLIQYCQNEIESLNNKNNPQSKLKMSNLNLEWTGSKISLIELIYGLASSKVFNNGKAEIKEIAAFFEIIFNIDLGDYYRAFIEIKSRKVNSTKFIDSLKSNLRHRIQNSDK